MSQMEFVRLMKAETEIRALVESLRIAREAIALLENRVAALEKGRKAA